MNSQFARKQPRQKRCRNPDCRAWFRPRNSTGKACSPRCAIVVCRADAAKRQRRADRVVKESLKTASDYRKEAQAAFNAWIRQRDHHKPCISCGKPADGDSDLLTGSRWDAGHYRSIGSNPELRFEPLNCHKQCVRCNRDRSGDVANYRISLRHRIGDDALACLEGSHQARKYRKEDFKAIRDYYRREARQIKKEREQQGSVTS